MWKLNLFPSVFLVATLFLIQVSSQQRYRPQSNQYSQSPGFSQSVPVSAPKSSASCPDKNGRYPTGQCDAYIECRDGVAEEKLCPDGLLFNAAASLFSYPCQYPIDVDCQGRSGLQPAQATEDCPHQFGYFKVGDETHCGQFKNCVDGRSHIFDCPEGLAFSPDTYRCDWPDLVQDCNAEAYLGFTCPSEPEARSGLGPSEYRFFRNADCQRYYICINGRPRLFNCGEGLGFNLLTNACDGLENITDCRPNSNANNYDLSFNQQRNPTPFRG